MPPCETELEVPRYGKARIGTFRESDRPSSGNRRKVDKHQLECTASGDTTLQRLFT
jgi:hypothetical protein